MRRVSMMTALTAMFLAASTAYAGGGDVVAYLGPDLSGNYTVLMVVGDQLDNEIRITEDADRHVSIVGLNGTTVNGQPSDENGQSSDEVDGFLSAVIDLGNGDDFVEYVFAGEISHGNREFNTGNGNDQVSIQVFGIAHGQVVDTGTGNDVVTVYVAYVAAGAHLGGLEINTGVGADDVFVKCDNSSGDPPFFFTGRTFIETEEGNDRVQFEGSFASSRTFSVSLGGGDDVLVGDSTSGAATNADADGGLGDDTVLNASYFFPYKLYGFETIVE